MEIAVQIRRVSDNATRIHFDCYAAGDDETWRYQWSDGNYGCDCNRGLFFARSAGEGDPDAECGEGGYVVDWIQDKATGAVLCDGDPRDLAPAIWAMA